jgi:ABC-type Fe3+/spermidine/putrescine transport system ATPase subunit
MTSQTLTMRDGRPAAANSAAPARASAEAGCELQVRGLVKRYAGATAVDGVDLTIPPGKLLTLLGPSGCGKTTILQSIAGFVVPEQGDVRVDGRSMLPIPPERRETAMLFQHYALFPHMSVRDNIAFGLKMRRQAAADIDRSVREAMRLVRIEEYAQRFPGQLSGGQKQRVALARAIVTRPKVLLLDEPLGALDQNLREAMQVELRKLQQGLGITSLIVTHDQKEAIALSDYIAVMNQGRIEQIGSPLDIYDRPHNRFVARFTGVENILPAQVLAASGGRSDVRVLGIAVHGVPGAALAAGSDALLAVRAEALDLTAGGAGVPGLVTFARALGAYVAYEVEAAGQTLSVSAHRRDGAVFEAGAVVQVRLNAEQCTLLPGDGA